MPGCDPVQPDYVVILKSNAAIIADRRIRGVPNIIIEVQSPGNSAYDERVKLVACLPTLPLAIADLFAGAPDTTL